MSTKNGQGSPKVHVTKNYRLFSRSDENRSLKIGNHRKLLQSMRTHGFISCCPIICVRKGRGELEVKDGQHRLAFAETLGLPVYYIEAHENFDVAMLNQTTKLWTLVDFAEKWASNGVKAYVDGINWAEKNQIPIGIAFALLGGATKLSGEATARFMRGEFKIIDLEWANTVAEIYGTLTAISPAVGSNNMIKAIMAVTHVGSFDKRRLLENAERCRDKLVAYAKRDDFLSELEAIYNFGKHKMFGLRIAAIMAMRDRQISTPGVKGASSNKKVGT